MEMGTGETRERGRGRTGREGGGARGRAAASVGNIIIRGRR